jgi:hypothetical protein
MRRGIFENEGESAVDKFVAEISSQTYKFEQRGVAQPG